MKKSLGFIYIILIVFSGSLKAQEPHFIPNDPPNKEKGRTLLKADSLGGMRTRADEGVKKVALNKDSLKIPRKYGWNVDLRSAARTMVNTDKTLLDFHQTSLVDGQGIAVGYLANLGSPSQSKLFFERGETGLFPFLNPFEYYYQKPEDFVFYNTTIPYTNIYYQSGGGRMTKEERLKTAMTMNFGKKFNFGFDIDYVYSRGSYSYLSNKQLTYNMYASYVSDRYQMHAYFAHNYYNNSENGGITDQRYITNVEAVLSNTKNLKSTDIPVRIEQMWNRLRGNQFFISNKYNLGYNKSGDSKTEKFIPVASFILTTNYSDQQRRIASKNETLLTAYSALATDTLYFTRDQLANSNFDGGYVSNQIPMEDHMAYWSFKNTFAISLNEGFRDWVKFGLTAFVEQDFRKFAMPSVARLPLVTTVESQNSTVIGGILSKQKGKFLRYNLRADLGVVGYNLGEFRVEADISTSIRFAGKEALVKANAYIKNLKPTFFENNFRTKYITWSNDFSDIKRVYIGGEIIIPQTGTRLSGGVENIDSYIYYGENKLIAQTNKNVQVVAARLDQKLKAGIFHWDNEVAYQVTSEKEIIPLPSLSLYTNVYILTKIAKVLTLQLGFDAHFHTKYYVPGYEPVTLQFYNQQTTRVGGFPIATGYVNLNLKNTRFFMMMYNIAESMGSSEYFTLPNYPVNPMTFKMGISWDFNN